MGTERVVSETDVGRDLRRMVARVWKRQVKLGIALPNESMRATLLRRLRRAVEPPPKQKRGR